MKLYNPRHLIVSTFLKGWRYNPPFYFWHQKTFYQHFEPIINKILDDPTTIVFIANQNYITPYSGKPFSVVCETPCLGWLIARKPNFLISFMVLLQARKQGLAKKMLNQMMIHLEEPRVVNLVYPTQALFVCSHKSLRGRTNVNAQVNNIDPYHKDEDRISA